MVSERSFTSALHIIYDPQTMLPFQIQKAQTPSLPHHGPAFSKWRTLKNAASPSLTPSQRARKPGQFPITSRNSRVWRLEVSRNRLYRERIHLSIPEWSPSLPRSSVFAKEMLVYLTYASKKQFWTSSKFKTLLLQRTHQKSEDNPQSGRKHLQIIHVIQV